MDNKVNYALVGFFVLVLGAMLIGIALWLSANVEKKHYRTYQMLMRESVSGLNLNAPVKYRGVNVGKVSSISISNTYIDQIQVLVDLEHGTPVKEDTLATLRSQGLTGLTFVELSGSTLGAADLQTEGGAKYPEIQTGQSLLVKLDSGITLILERFDILTRSAENAMIGFNIFSENMNELLDEDNRRTVGNILRHVESLSSGLADNRKTISHFLQNSAATAGHSAGLAAELEKKVPHFLAELSKTARSIGQLSAEAKKVVSENRVAFKRTSFAAAEAVEQLSQTLSTGQPSLNRLGQETVPILTNTLQDVQHTLQAITQLVQTLEKEPTQLIFGKSQERLGPGE